MEPKYNNYRIYIHNFSFFDAIFLLRILSELTNINIKPIIRDGRIIDLKFSFYIYDKSNMLNLYFRDSYLLLPSSLAKLAKNFKVENKGIFPYEFVNNKNIPLNYRGPVPAREFYPYLTIEQYKSMFNSYEYWDLRIETIRYCEQDVVTLYQILQKFQKKIFTLFRLDILKYPTLPSLAFAIYRSKFMGNAKIPLIDGNLFNQLKKGYTGGSVDVYKPYGENIYRYDVNSLYPYVMREYPMPVGNPTLFEGDISIISEGNGYNLINRPFGFFEVEITAPENLGVPLLQTRIKTFGGTRTIAPLGTWTGTYFSEEIYNAMSYGYKFKILRGYLFDKGYIFKDYVDYLYNLKVNSEKASPDYIISKLLLNSLYGRFGMNPHCENHLIINSKDSLDFQNKNLITNVIDLKNGRELISFFEENEWSDEVSKKSLNISVSVSAAVTASARIHMSQFKNMKDLTLYYTDTDSIDIDQPLDPKYVDKELGKMKLEHIFKEAVFLAPKVYGGITSEYELVKVKGLKNPVSYNELKTLLVKDTSLKVNQDKWYRDMSQGLIKIKTSSINWTVKLKSVVCILILKLCLLYLNILSIYKYIVCTNIIILVLYTRCCMWIYNIQIIKYKRGKIISRVRMMVCGSIDSSSNLEFYPLVN
jgi:DNA polymerase type B, organellar and viral